jgi:hypothetical protein
MITGASGCDWSAIHNPPMPMTIRQAQARSIANPAITATSSQVGIPALLSVSPDACVVVVVPPASGWLTGPVVSAAAPSSSANTSGFVVSSVIPVPLSI